MSKKYIFITGGVCSSLGKGLTAASIGLLLEKRGLKVALLKLDPYLNVDPGTMNPFQHGEVYVTDDGSETDLDLGHYYRYTHSPLSKDSNATSGQIYDTVIKRERKGDYLGKTVQVIPHITDEIKARIYACEQQEDAIDVVLIEIGGTVGDIESLPFLEAIRQFYNEHKNNSLNIHLTFVPLIRAAGEVKTKPTQHSVQKLSELGLFPDIIICRCEDPLPTDVKEKISLFCNVPINAVIEEPDVTTTIYELPIVLHKQKLDEMICKSLSLSTKPITLNDWNTIIKSIQNPKGTVKIGVVGKYVSHQDAYKSVFEALHHAGINAGYQISIIRFEADQLENTLSTEINHCDGILVPGGFGERGWEGKIKTARFCREKKLPYFGICLGMQVMTIEFARHKAMLKDANSTEMNPNTPHPVISLLSEQKNVKNLGGTMRLGAFEARLKSDTLAEKAYGKKEISERHRHRYEFNNAYQKALEDKGLEISGTLLNGELCEIVEVKDHPWMVGVQFHPEFKSRPTEPHPLFKEFILAAIQHKEKNGSNC